jgi:hypothetical protein
MITVSEAWKAAQDHFLAPEGFVELSCYIPQLRQTLVYTKSDIMSFTHQQTGSIMSGELPKNHIEFKLDNSDGKWNPSNPTGLERYLSERLKITLRYGMDIDGVIEWIPGGVFYLSEWHTPANGIEASFVARDLLEYMIDKTYTGELVGTLYEVAERAVAEAGIPSDAVVSLCDELKNYSVGAIDYQGNESVAEILQKCANAASCVMYQDRDGVLRVKRLGYENTGFVIPKSVAYTFPEIEFSRPLKGVSVSYFGNEKFSFIYDTSGETQTLTNEFISTEEQASEVAKWVCDALRTRKKISGEVRGDPRLDVFDVIDVESKYGVVNGVVLTDIKCSFTGAFRAVYTGYVRGSGAAVMIYSGEIFAGEVE